MRTAFLPFLIAGLFSACSSPVLITVVDPVSHNALPGIIVERHRPASMAARISNPVGSFYHPHSVTESASTDSTGTATLKGFRADDRLIVIDPDHTRSLLLTTNEKTVRLDPPPNNTGLKWGFSVWIDGNAVKTSAWERRVEYATWHR